jgi:hypothetical protein
VSEDFEKRRAQKAYQAKLDKSDWAWLMSDRRGRRIAATLIDLSNNEESSIDHNTAAMAFKEGLRWYGVLLTRMLKELCFDKYIEMLKEQNNGRISTDEQ